MSDRLVGYSCAITVAALVASNVWVARQVTDLKSEVSQITSEVQEIKQEVVMYKTATKIKLANHEVQCLAKNIFYEAGVESEAGKIAVAQVTLNRVNSGRWGNTVCDVVYAKAQFSWTSNKKKRNATPKGKLWDESVAAAEKFLKGGSRIKGLEDSGFYHTTYIATPNWAKYKKVAHQVGQHIFYSGVNA